MRLLLALPILAFASQLSAQSSSDTAAVRNIVKNEIDTWNKGDAVGYSRDFAGDGTFTNIRGQFFTGYPGYLKQHEVIFEGIFKNSTLQQDVVSLRFVRPDVAIIETATTVAGAAQSPVGVARDDNGRIRTRLLQVVAKEGGVWKIVTYHNVDVKPGIPFPQPRPAVQSSAIRSINEAQRQDFDWGTLYTYFQDESYGTRDGLAAVAVIKPGREIHPPHQHAEEEYLMVVEGHGTWHLNGRERPAKPGDMQYAAPWDVHGIKNTGRVPLRFVVWKWNSQGVVPLSRPQ